MLRIDAEPALQSLHHGLAVVLADAGIALDERPFAPHVTLARKAARAEPPPMPAALEWRTNGFALVESLPGRSARYEVLRRFGPADQTCRDIDSG